MKTMRILLPFTSGVDMDVLEQAVLLAKGYNAILIPLALIQLPETRRSKGARLEHIQQAKDFLEAVRQKAAKYSVSTEQHEVFTRNVVQSIGATAQQVECDGIFLFVRGKKSMLLSDDEVECIMTMDDCTFYIVHLAAKENNGFPQMLQMLQANLFNWLHLHLRRQEREETVVPTQETFTMQCQQIEELSPQRPSADLEEPARR